VTQILANEEAEKARDTFVENLADAQAEINGGGDAAAKLKQPGAQEKQCRTATCISGVRGKLGDSGLSSVSYRLDNRTITETMDQSVMEHFFIKANEAKIQQARDIMCMAEPMASEVGWLGIGPKV
jgi:hypothetical protein